MSPGYLPAGILKRRRIEKRKKKVLMFADFIAQTNNKAYIWDFGNYWVAKVWEFKNLCYCTLITYCNAARKLPRNSERNFEPHCPLTFVRVPGGTTKKSPWIKLKKCATAPGILIPALEKFLSWLLFGVGNTNLNSHIMIGKWWFEGAQTFNYRNIQVFSKSAWYNYNFIIKREKVYLGLWGS